jgi:hypothetical protein
MMSLVKKRIGLLLNFTSSWMTVVLLSTSALKLEPVTLTFIVFSKLYKTLVVTTRSAHTQIFCLYILLMAPFVFAGNKPSQVAHCST